MLQIGRFLLQIPFIKIDENIKTYFFIQTVIRSLIFLITWPYYIKAEIGTFLDVRASEESMVPATGPSLASLFFIF